MVRLSMGSWGGLGVMWGSVVGLLGLWGALGIWGMLGL